MAYLQVLFAGPALPGSRHFDMPASTDFSKEDGQQP
jgi:hypothetical protein